MKKKIPITVHKLGNFNQDCGKDTYLLQLNYEKQRSCRSAYE